MQLSLAQHASAKFCLFIGEFTENGLPEEYESLLSDQVLNVPEALDRRKARIEHITSRCHYLTDYLQIWLLSGEGVRQTVGNVSIYFQTMALVFGEFTQRSELYDPCQKAMPAPTEHQVFAPISAGGINDDVAFSGYPLPLSLSSEFYAYCAQPVPAHVRQKRIRDLFLFDDQSAMRRVTVAGW